MSNTNSAGTSAGTTPHSSEKKDVHTERARVRPDRLPVRKTGPDYSLFEQWLSELGMLAKPTVHVNGPQFASCLMTVDFGMPLKQPRLTTDQSADLSARLRKAAGDLVMSDARMRKTVESTGRDVSIRVYSDNSTGVWWACVG